MRSVKLFVATSLDNYIARSDSSVDWLFMDRDYGMSAFFKTIDTLIMGRKTHDFAMAHGMPVYPGMKNYVLTHQHGRDTFGGAVEYVSGDAAKLVRGLKVQPGKGIWIVGGVGIVDDLFRAGLVDEVMLAVHPRLLGSGVRLFGGELPETELRLKKHKVWDNGLVSLEYEVVRVDHEGHGGHF